MDSGKIGDLMYEFFVLCVQLAGPVLIISMIVGIVISLLQAATQIHEQTLTFVPKLVVIGVILIISGSKMLATMQNFTIEVFNLIAG